ncbi:helix-turn-helix transcriptional regulator [Pseudomonas sp. H9]|nr:helix-turn-helix transcriptional regulator [Pseudomonas sp. H9]
MALPVLQPYQLRLPAEPARALTRGRLLERLAQAVDAGCFTLLQAPLGYGKSTLLSQFAHRQDARSAWLRLSAVDNQPLSLLVHLQAALGMPPPGATSDAQCLWRDIQQHLEQLTAPLNLLLDDLHLLQSPQACHYLEQLLHYPLANLRLLAASEGPPRLPLAHLRRDARLVQINAHDLALDSDETRQLAEQRNVQLSADAIYQLRAGSEGWISGVLLWLNAYCQVATSGQAPSDLRAITLQSYAHARQFLEEERLRQLKPELLRLLERTSVVQAFDLELAQGLSAGLNVREQLRQLQRLDLFIETRPGEHREYRYHPVLRTCLCQRLEQRNPQQLRQLHQQAAQWLLEHRHFTEALHQFVRAKNFEAMLSIVDQHAFELLREGKINTLVDFLAEMAGQAGSDSLTLATTEASIVIVTNDVAHLRQCLRRVQGLLRQQAPARHPQRVQQTLAFLRTRLAYLGGNLMHSLRIAEHALQQIPEANAASSVLRFDRACCLYALGSLDEAEIQARQALSELQAFGLSGYTNLLQLLLGQIELAQGKGEAAWQRFLSMASDDQHSSSGIFYTLFHHMGKGLVLLQANQLEQARQCLNQAETLALDFPHCAALAWVFHHQACLYWALGEAPLAKARWDEVRRMARQYNLFLLYRQASAWRVRLALRDDDQAFLLLWLDEWHGCFARYGEYLLPEEWLAYAWVQRHLGQHRKAWQIHANLKEQALAQRNHRLLLDTLMLETALAHDSTARDSALCCLEQAVQLASEHGFGQLLHYEGHDMLESVQLLLQPQAREQLRLTAPAPSRERLNQLFGRLLASKEQAHPALIVPLSKRELAVLQRLARGQTNQQIAEALFISLSTVKTHINNLFRKLDVADRDSARRMAQTLGLLD